MVQHWRIFELKWSSAEHTFADEFARFLAICLALHKVDGSVFRNAIKVQMSGQQFQLLLRKSLAQKSAHLLNFAAEVSFHVFVEEEEDVGVLSFCPSFQNVSEKWGIIQFVVHKVLGKLLDVAREVLDADDLVVMEI